MTKSPLRYPGGKTRAVKILTKFANEHFPNRKIIISPFLGGGSFEIEMEKIGYTVYANDLFKPLFIFWKAVQEHKHELIARIRSFMPMDKARFMEYRMKIKESSDEIDIAAYYYLINRSSFSGSTFCGGFSQQACDGRLGDNSIKTIETFNATLHIENLDCNKFLEKHPQTEETLIYADPPYYITSYLYGRDGDMHESFDHEAFAHTIKKRNDYIISYNDCEYIRELYKNCRIFEVAWSYGMNKTKKSSEILILPPI